MLVDLYQLRSGWNYDWLKSVDRTAVAGLQNQYQRLSAEGYVAEAIELYHSLRNIGYAPDEDSYLALLEQHWLKHIENENRPLAINSFLQLLSYDYLSKERIEEGLRYIHSKNDEFAFESALRIIGSDFEYDAEEFRFSSVPISEQIKGTAMIWVNKGIRLDRGVGMPDRMIGSGFFIDNQGHLLTNYHVIESEVNPRYSGYSRVYIRPPDAPETRIPATVIGFDPILDLALLKVPYTPDYVFPLTGMRDRPVGSQVFAIGSPGGLSNTITSGIISAGGRRFLQIGEALQVDAPLNPGNSGGPVLDIDGNLVGVVYAGIAQFDGVNFAVPSFWLRGILERLYEPGRIEHSYLGASVFERHNGLEITHVIVGSPADRSGFQVGDLIVEIQGNSVNSIEQANRIMLQYRPGSLMTVRLRIQENTNIIQRVQLTARPERPLEASIRGVSSFPESLFPALFGMFVKEIRSGWFVNDYSIQRVLSGSIADEAGLSVNDPLSLQKWEYNEETEILRLQLRVKKRQSGYMDSSIQIPVHILTSNIL
ncbi:hypothetical protein JCM12856_19830 [Spirochaeta dissipatitropha]